jgi:hypothetical protein
MDEKPASIGLLAMPSERTFFKAVLSGNGH